MQISIVWKLADREILSLALTRNPQELRAKIGAAIVDLMLSFLIAYLLPA